MLLLVCLYFSVKEIVTKLKLILLNLCFLSCICPFLLVFIYYLFVSYSREFTHRVKSVSMAKFTSQEVEALQNGGNQVQAMPNILALLQKWDTYPFADNILTLSSVQEKYI